jgi:DNA polymerase-3 subunit alpha
MEYIPSFIRRKHGEEPITFDLPDMEENLSETYGITVYQEQVMLLSQKLAKFSKGEADILRKAMGKKQKDVLDKMKGKFIDQALALGHPEDKLQKIWKDWEAFAQYAFNKSHSTCYALLAYQTAYLKAHHPEAFMASCLSNNLSDLKELTKIINDCKRKRLEVLLPDVNESNLDFTVNAKGAIRFGLGGMKGVGEGAVLQIIEERKKNGPYKGLYDFVKRVDLRSVNKKTLESLALGGAFDGFEGEHRAMYFHEVDGRSVIENAIKYSGDKAEVSISVNDHDGSIAIIVADQGPGVDAEQLRHLGERFYRAEQHRQYGDGAGLGLSIAARVAALHGGKLEFALRQPHGLCAILTIEKTENYSAS